MLTRFYFFFGKARFQNLQSIKIKREDSLSQLHRYILDKHSHSANAFTYTQS